MNLAQMKTALENSVKEALVQSLNESINVTTHYDANTASITVELTDAKEVVNGRSSILCYNIIVAEEDKSVSIVAFNRIYIHDGLGISLVNNEPVAVTSKFMNDITSVILFGMDRIYHPENYSQPEPQEALEEAEHSVEE
jgi:hypothetical protein